MSAERLQPIFAAGPSAAGWHQLLGVLDAWGGPLPLVELDTRLAAWPIELLTAPAEAWRAARRGVPPAWWPLVRRVQLTLDDEADEASLAALSAVTSLVVVHARWLLDGVELLDRLELLELAGVDGLASLAEVPPLPRLAGLLAHDCPALASLDGLAAQPALRSLGIARCPQLASLTALSSAPHLTHVTVRGCPLVADYSSSQ